MGRLAGKSAIILGATNAGNMAQTIARRFTDEGAQVVVAGRKIDELQRFADEIGGFAVHCDITKRDDIFTMTQAAKEKLGKVDIGVNSTGWALFKPFLETTEEELDALHALQFRGPFLFFQAMIEAMDQGGSIIQISSVVAKIVANDHAAYQGTKAGTNHVTRLVAHEFGERGIRINTISPGLTETPMASAFFSNPAIAEEIIHGYPLGRLGTCDDIAAAATFLASDECFMTGEDLQVNGGLHLRGYPSKRTLASLGL